LLNEATPAGSGNNPDCLEFICLGDGNLAGLTFYVGTSAIYNGMYRFPDMQVQQGDYIILHCRPEFEPWEKNETTRKDESSGLLSSPDAWDLWCPEDTSLPGTNGILALYSLPQDGSIVDCMIYTNRELDAADEKFGWTSSIYKQLKTLDEGVWQSQGEFITPADALWGDDSTGTRSLCRDSSSTDTDSASDWHTVPTGKKSFGSINNDEEY